MVPLPYEAFHDLHTRSRVPARMAVRNSVFDVQNVHPAIHQREPCAVHIRTSRFVMRWKYHLPLFIENVMVSRNTPEQTSGILCRSIFVVTDYSFRLVNYPMSRLPQLHTII